MKRIFLYLMALPLLAFMTACHDDDKDLPNVSLSVEYSGATVKDGVFYVEKGETFTIDALKAVPAPGTKEAALGNTTYAWDGVPFYTIGVAPYGVEIATADMELGAHTLTVTSTILQVDKEIGFGVFEYPVMIVEPASPDLPDGPDSGTVTPDTRISDK